MNQYPDSAPARKGKKASKVIVTIFSVLLGLFAVSLAVVFPKSEQFVVELGDKASASPSDYLFGYGFIIDRATIDVGKVDTGKVGEYKGTAKLFFYNYPLQIKVTDTTPPEILPYEEELYIATGREYAPEYFAESISDLSGAVKCRISYNGAERTGISFPEAGHYSLSLTAEDDSGNIGTQEIAFTVDDPPVIIGAFDRHLPLDADFDITGAAAIDTEDGNISDKITVSSGGFDPHTEGEYTVTYTVSDSHGLITEKAVTFSVCSRQKLKLYSDDISLTTDELRLLCNADYFAYKPLELPDYDSVLQLVEPTLVDFKQERSNGYAAGSGCIYKITPEYTYLLSVKHVIQDVHKHCDVMFFDGTVVREDIDYVTSQKKNELSLCRIPTSDIPADTLMTLRQVFVDREIYSKLSKGDEVVAYAKHWTGTNKDIVKRLKVKKLTSSIGEFGLYDSLLETTEGVVGGMSGTAVVDLRGNLVGLASAYGTATDSRYAVSSYHSKIDVLDEAEAAFQAEQYNNAA